METIRKHQRFKCWKCGRTFSLYKEFQGAPKLVVECPFCGASCIADLAPFRKKTTEVMKGDASSEMVELHLPEILPTTNPENRQD